MSYHIKTWRAGSGPRYWIAGLAMALLLTLTVACGQDGSQTAMAEAQAAAAQAEVASAQAEAAEARAASAESRAAAAEAQAMEAKAAAMEAQAAAAEAKAAAESPRRGEDRPTITVIGSGSSGGTGTGTGTGSGSGTGTGTATAAVPAMASAGGEFYVPVSNVEPHANLALDMRDIAGLLNAAKSGDTVDYAAITNIYENGIHADGRTLAGYAASDSVLAQFPSAIDLDGNVRAGLTGKWAGRQVSDPVRRQLTNKGLQAIIYGKVLQEMASARSQMEAGNLDDASGAPHKVDEAWAFYVGAADPEGNRRYSIANTARSREGNFKLAPKVSVPLAQALSDALEASRAGDMAGYDAAAAEVKARLNTIFYLASLRYAYVSSTDTDESSRAQHLAEAWAFFQAIAPIVASASLSIADSINDIFSQDPSETVSESDVGVVYKGLNDPAVVEALGIPLDVRVTSPDALK